VRGGGGPPRPFRDVTPAYRKSLATQVTAIRTAIDRQLKATVIAPVRVKVLTQAAAKSHRPKNLFSEKTCPIVGAGRLGELFVKATAAGLDNLAKVIEQSRSEQMIKELSCVETIEPITPALRRRGSTAAEILRRSPRRKNGFITRVNLFNFGPNEDQQALVTDFEALCAKRGIQLNTRGYSQASLTYAAECRSEEDVDAISKALAVRSISHMPLVRLVRPRAMNPQPLPALPQRKAGDADVPVVVVVDSGITDTVPALNSWVVGRDRQVAAAYRNTSHGTFVAGLICWGADLNPTLAGLGSGPCAVFDLQVFPNDDPAHGATTVLLEQELLFSLDAALQEHANQYKVWNLSLGTDALCSIDEFSPLAVELDDLQEKYRFPSWSRPATTGQFRFWTTHEARLKSSQAGSRRPPTASSESRLARSRMLTSRKMAQSLLTHRPFRDTEPGPTTSSNPTLCISVVPVRPTPRMYTASGPSRSRASLRTWARASPRPSFRERWRRSTTRSRRRRPPF